MTDTCGCPSATDGSCAHCGRVASDQHKERCHRVAIGGARSGLNLGTGEILAAIKAREDSWEAMAAAGTPALREDADQACTTATGSLSRAIRAANPNATNYQVRRAMGIVE